MDVTLQQLIVTLMVMAAALFSAWKLMPARRRLRALMACDRWAGRHPLLAGFRERVLRPRIARAAGTGCSGCDANPGSRPHRAPR